MAKISRQVGSTSQLVDLFVQDSSSTVGAGLGSIAYNTSGLIAYYHRNTASASVAISLATMTLGTWATGGLVVVDGTHMLGLYQLSIPNAALVSGADTVTIYLSGVTNMAPCVLEIELTATSNQDAVHGGMSALPNTACTTNDSLLTSGTGTDQISVSAGKLLLQATQSGVTIPTVTTVGTLTTYTGNTVQTGDSYARLGAPSGASIDADILTRLATSGYTVPPTAAAIGAVVAAGAVASVTGAVGSISGVTFPTHFSSLAIDSGGDVTFNNTSIATVTTVGTLTTYTGNTPQTGDSYARIGSTGSGLSSLAAASTALSSAQWTNTRAGYLDNLSGGAVALASGVILTSAGMDNVVVEVGLNARQSLSIIGSACAGASSGVSTGSPIYTGAGVATQRISGTAANGDRSGMTLSPPT